MYDFSTLRSLKVKDQTVLLRTDYNVPFLDGQISDASRIRASLPTIKQLLKQGTDKIIILSHLGRPAGQVVPDLSLQPVAQRLQQLLPKVPVQFVNDVSGPDVEMAVEQLPSGGILLLENLRFYPGEEANDAEFAREIVDSTHASLFIQDGFAVLHRAHASTTALPQLLPAAVGLLVEQELTALTKLLKHPDQPFVIIIGGAKVTDKQPLIDQFSPLASKIIIAGKIAATGYTNTDPKIYVAEDFDQAADGAKLDIGPLSTAKIIEFLSSAKTVLWNGVLGKVEDPAYSSASTAVANFLGTHPQITSIICGGDTTGFVGGLQTQNPELHFSLLSTGGGATLELLTGSQLPGLTALTAAAE